MILAGFAAVISPLSGAAWQDTPRPLLTDTELLRDPGGTPLVHLAKGVTVAAGATRGTAQLVTVDGWVAQSDVHDDKRDGFDVSVTPAGGTALREKQAAGVTLGMAHAGTSFLSIETKGNWVHVRRAGWVARAAIDPVAQAGAPVTTPVAAPAPHQTPAAPPSAPPQGGQVTIPAGATFSAVPTGTATGTLEALTRADVVERRGGWTHVRIDAWIADRVVGDTTSLAGITAADLRAAPDKYVGKTVEWTLQVLAIQRADELRPELPQGQPYVLASGPLPETGFVYLAIPPTEVDSFRALDPLAKVKVRATIRAAHSRFLPTPVLTFVRRLD
ncbi:MAG TPA: hypothetical protein VHW65_02020 [Gemmatimonadales bacterium]|nr:hypothetical protein [Gemmatimonadales bacterium]